MMFLKSALQHIGLKESPKIQVNLNIDESLLKKDDDFIENNHKKVMSLVKILHNLVLLGIDIEMIEQKCIELVSLFINSLRAYPQTIECDEEMIGIHTIASLNDDLKVLFDQEFERRYSEWIVSENSKFYLKLYRKHATMTFAYCCKGITSPWMQKDLKERNPNIKLDFIDGVL